MPSARIAHSNPCVLLLVACWILSCCVAIDLDSAHKRTDSDASGQYPFGVLNLEIRSPLLNKRITVPMPSRLTSSQTDREKAGPESGAEPDWTRLIETQTTQSKLSPLDSGIVSRRLSSLQQITERHVAERAAAKERAFLEIYTTEREKRVLSRSAAKAKKRAFDASVRPAARKQKEETPISDQEYWSSLLEVEGGVSGPCSALWAAHCRPCFKFGAPSSPLCKTAAIDCIKSFCLPLCTRMTWEVDFEVNCGGDGEDDRCDKLAAQLSTERFKKGLGGVFIAHGCDKMLGCCPKPHIDMEQFAEDHNYGGFFPGPGTMAEGCEHNAPDGEDSGSLCDMCNAAVVVKLLPKDDCDDVQVQPKPESTGEFTNSLEAAPTQIPSHKPFQERCVHMKALATGMFGAFQSTFQANVCECLGCCNDKKAASAGRCFYPINH